MNIDINPFLLAALIISLLLNVWGDRDRKTLKRHLDSVEFAAHMPGDYEYGLPSWVNQVLYRAYLNWDDWKNNRISKAEDLEQIIRLQMQLNKWNQWLLDRGVMMCCGGTYPVHRQGCSEVIGHVKEA